jgi:phytoene dehydrogenase-like protein
MKRYDAVVGGGGHNGLTAPCYLARASGLSARNAATVVLRDLER